MSLHSFGTPAKWLQGRTPWTGPSAHASQSIPTAQGCSVPAQIPLLPPGRPEAASNTLPQQQTNIKQTPAEELELLIKDLRTAIDLVQNISDPVKLTTARQNMLDAQGKVHNFAQQLAPFAQANGLKQMMDQLNPQPGEKGLVITAGAGNTPASIYQKTLHPLYVHGMTTVQMRLAGLPSLTKRIDASPENSKFLQQIGNFKGKLDFVTSFCALHSLADKDQQDEMFRNFAQALRPGGRMVIADIAPGSSLAQYYQNYVTRYSLLPYRTVWVDPSLGEKAGMELQQKQQVEEEWKFQDEKQMALFLQALHAYKDGADAVTYDLSKLPGSFGTELGVTRLWCRMHLWTLIKQ